MPAIITSRTRSLYTRPPGGPVCLNAGSMQAQGLAAWWPLIDGVRDLKDYAGRSLGMSLSGSPTTVLGIDGGFAVDFSGTSQSLTRSSAVVTDVPLTMACWFNSDTATATDALVALYGSSSFDHHVLAAAGATGGDPVQAISYDDSAGATGTASSATGYTANRWHHACGVFAAAASRSAYIDGRSKGTNTTSSAPGSLNTTRIANGGAIGPGLLDGRIAHPCIWNRAFSDAEVYALYDPPTRWELYWPLGRRVFVDLGGGASGAITGTAALVVTGTGTQTGAGTLVVSESVIITVSTTIIGAAAASCSESIVFSTSSPLLGAGTVAGLSPLVISADATSVGAASLAISAAITIETVSALIGDAVLTSTSSLTVTASGTTVGDGAVISTVSLAITTEGVAVGAGTVSGTSALSITESSVIVGAGTLTGTTPLIIIADTVVIGAGTMSAPVTIAVSAAGVMEAVTTLAAVIEFVAQFVYTQVVETRLTYAQEIDVPIAYTQDMDLELGHIQTQLVQFPNVQSHTVRFARW